jgi:hypothetical protein
MPANLNEIAREIRVYDGDGEGGDDESTEGSKKARTSAKRKNEY